MSAVALHDPETQRRDVARLPSVGTGFFDLNSFELTQRVARCLASSSLVPQIYRGNTPEAVGNCMIAINFAQRVQADPLMVMQNLNIIQGRPSWGSPFLIALVNTCGKFTTLRFEFFGEPGEDSYGCRASAKAKATGETLVGTDITIALAKAEGWYGRNGSKWKTMAQQMLIYRAAAFWARVYAPELSMGLLTAEEAEDIVDLPSTDYRDVTPAKSRARSRAAVAAPSAPADEPVTIENDEPPADKTADEPRLDAAQVAALLTLATETGADIDKVCKWAGVNDFSELPAEQFDRVRDALEAKRRKAQQSNPAADNPSTAAETPADHPPAGQPLASEHPPLADAGGTPDPIAEARAAGRKACRDGASYDAVPKKFARYTSWAAAWQEGYQEEGERMEAEMNQ